LNIWNLADFFLSPVPDIFIACLQNTEADEDY